jgi:hypothetical protein
MYSHPCSKTSIFSRAKSTSISAATASARDGWRWSSGVTCMRPFSM